MIKFIVHKAARPVVKNTQKQQHRNQKQYCYSARPDCLLSHKKTAALLSIAGSSGTLDRLPSMFRLTRLRLFLLEHAAGLSISSRNIGNDNNTACPYCTAGPAVFARVRLETNQSADCPDEPDKVPGETDKVPGETDRSGLVRITEGQVKTARPCSFYICLFVFASACDFISVPASVFASLLFSFFTFSFF